MIESASPKRFDHDDTHGYYNTPLLWVLVPMSIALVAPLHASKYQGCGVLEFSDERPGGLGCKLSLELMLSRVVNSVSPIPLVSNLSTLSLFPLSRPLLLLLLFGFYDLEMTPLNTW